MKNAIVTAGAIIIALAGIVWIAQPRPLTSAEIAGATSKGQLSLQESDNYDFGTISMAAGTVRHLFKIKNTGFEAVNLGKMYTSCMCTTAGLILEGKQYGPFGMPGHGMIPKIGQVLEPGQEAEIEVVFDPAAHGPAGVGAIARVVTLESNGNKLNINFKAVVAP